MRIGTKIRRIRELRGMKQDTLATLLGVTRQAVSKIEQSENVDNTILEKISKGLGVPIEAIRNFNEEAVINIISSALYDTSGLVNYYPNFTLNPIEKIIELFEENKRLYERLIESERSKK